MLGGLGGAINAALCYAKLPVPTGEQGSFEWHVIPAGGAHGALLALIAAGCAAGLWNQRAWIRWAAVPVVGWLAGWLSWIPLHLSIVEGELLKAILWPFSNSKELVLGLWQYFGLVSLLCYAGLQWLRRFSPRHRWAPFAVGIGSGCLGSLWWWIEVEPWYFSLLHGTIWGSLVGFGIWRAQSLSAAE